ncbi:MAG: glycoside hydrolase family 99-like domain-containing protein [Pseudomonadales bacterium]|nr:glycoside hydrolase family 99-like domain-containing protein [Pseudomonadales bacterium]
MNPRTINKPEESVVSVPNSVGLSADEQKKIKLIAFYLTQYHPIPENDKWWGKGFTEWTNSTRAQALFDGHYQPHLPADMGFYDLRVRETRHEQIALAKQYGIEGFCYHYYWFSGQRVLNKPLDDMLSDSSSEMPFCLCWANENWTRRWDAADHEILLEQKYLSSDAIKFVEDIIPYLKDPRYLKIQGKPFLIVYAPQHIPNVLKTLDIWRNHCREQGIGEVHLCAALTHGNSNYIRYGFDSAVEFPPHNLQSCKNISSYLRFYQPFYGNVFSFKDVARNYLDKQYEDKNVFRSVFPSWDNTARTGSRAIVVLESSPENYEYWLNRAIEATQKAFPNEERFVFINAWNEWAEGCHLEPDQKYLRGYLEATLRVVEGKSKISSFKSCFEKSDALGESQGNSYLREILSVTQYHLAVKIGKFRNFINQYPHIKKRLVPLIRRLKSFLPIE